ncbi:Mannan endo-1-4-beta-mannosidase 7 [Striga hermonthica]|uniref:mannan endo-1,4-beta-mannosidase n=1 Tax=Striga hermonthica TaxID=68872 RepID=A0A9N7RU53_STRHE|nr:Mannan endo-1-4-beta-mannosidase 7 [Striga hermonthica]
MLNGSPFYANGFNAYWLMYVASDPSQRDKITFAFQEAANYGLLIARAWAFGDGGYSPLQYSPGYYNEHMFLGLDFVISEAGRYGIKLILSLVNNYEDSGGKRQYVKWARDQGHDIVSDDEFFTNTVVKEYYKNHIKTVLTRQNNITGIAYKDDPTIMAWELMNEPRCPTDPSATIIQAWIEEMASYLKSIDPQHLLEAGLEGFYRKPEEQQNLNFKIGTDFITNNQIPDIDFATLHSYPDQWLNGQTDEDQLSFLKDWLDKHIQDTQTILQKPLLIAEFGKSSKDTEYTTKKRDELFSTVYTSIYSSARDGGVAAGALFWQLLTENMDSFRDGYEIVFTESPSTARLIAEQCQKLNEIRKLHDKPKFL